MTSKIFIYAVLTVISLGFLLLAGSACGELRKDVEDLMHKVGWEKPLNKGVEVHPGGEGLISIVDDGTFLVQHVIQDRQVATEPNVVIDPELNIPANAKKLTIVAHGWVDKAEDDWPMEMAAAIRQKIDPNEWICAVFDWRSGAKTINAADAARYARDIAGPRLAAALCQLSDEYEHIHLIAHSAGSWAIDSAAKNISQKYPKASIHLTFLDAYIPPKWDPAQLAKIPAGTKHWADHYYTKDFTLKVTQTNLPNACNVDITDIDPYFKEHRFPYRWYHATIEGKYGDHFTEKKLDVLDTFEGVAYGFTRSLEAGIDNFKKSLRLKTGKTAIKLKDDELKKNSKCPIFGIKKEK